MVKIKYLFIVAVVVGMGIWTALYFSRSEGEKVKKQFGLLSKWMSKASDETPLRMAQKIKDLSTLFAEDCGLKLPHYSISGSFPREEITGYATRARLPFSELSLRFYDLVLIFPEEGKATVTLTARLKGKTNIGEQVDETHELVCVLKKIENRWLFSDFEVVEILKK